MINQNTNQSNFLNRTRQLIRRCSFCRNQEHNISQCNDQRLIDFQENLRNKRSGLMEIISIDLGRKIEYFQTWLCSNNQKLIKSYAMRFCGAYSRHSVRICLIKIVNHIWNDDQDILSNLNQLQVQFYQPQPQFQFQTPVQDDFIPFSQSSLSQDFTHLDMRLTEFLYELRNSTIVEETSENRKYDITSLLCIEVESKEKTAEKILEELEAEEDCNICYDEKKNRDMITLNCNHKFCGTCVHQLLKKCNPNKLPCCAMCRVQIDFITIKNENIMNELKANLA